MSKPNTPDWTHPYTHVWVEGKRTEVPITYEREDILPGGDMMPDPHIAVLRHVSVACGLCNKEGIETALEVDTSGCEYDVLFLCADCVRMCLEKMKE